MFASGPVAPFRKSIDAVRELALDGVFRCDQGGITMEVMDSSHVALVSLSFSREWFTRYECPEPHLLGIKLSSLAKILKCAGPNDTLVLEHANGKDVLSIQCESENRERVSVFDLKLMQVETDQLSVPEIPFDVTCALPSTEFQRIVRDLGTLGDTVVLEGTGEGLRFSVAGELGNGGVRLEKSEAVTIEVANPASASFSVRFLQAFAKATPLSDSVSLGVSGSMPLRVCYSGDEARMTLVFYLAPKLDDDY
jgi:proliferating cell nuclear antigen